MASAASAPGGAAAAPPQPPALPAPAPAGSASAASSAAASSAASSFALSLDLLLPQAVLKNLADRTLEKRKLGALEVEKVMRRLREQQLAGGPGGAAAREAARRIIHLLVQDFACSPNSNNRKGGLTALASCAIGLMALTAEHLEAVVPAVLRSFADQEPRVRYYACEALFNITKICRDKVLPYFSEIFVGLCRLVPDVDTEVKNGAGLFDRLLKEVVMEGERIDVERFVPLLRSHMVSANPYVRTLLVGWIMALDCVPGVDMLDHLPALLEGLFDMLSDGNKEVRFASDAALGMFLDRLHAHAAASASAHAHTAHATKVAAAASSVSASSSSSVLPVPAPDVASELLGGGMTDFAERVQFRPLVDILVQQTAREKDKFTRKTAVDWLSQFLVLGRGHLAPVYDVLLAALLRCLSDPEAELVDEAARANGDLMLLVRHTTPATAEEAAAMASAASARAAEAAGAKAGAAPAHMQPQPQTYDPQPLLRAVLAEISNRDRLRRSTALKWVAMLLEQCPLRVRESVDPLLRGLLSNLLDTGDGDVLKLNLEVLARLAATDLDFLCGRIAVELVRLFGEHRALLEQKASFVVRRLCLLLEPRLVFLSLARILLHEPNREFAGLLVDLLNLILLTSLELCDFRDALRGCAAPGAGEDEGEGPGAPSSDNGAADADAAFDAEAGAGDALGAPVSAAALQALPPLAVFLRLFRTWTHNPVATLALCLLAGAYELAARIVARLGEAQVTVGLLMQVDKLVQLLESPIFLHTRMHLLEPARADAAPLLRALFGLLMLLPQGAAFATLKERLMSVTGLHVSLGQALQAQSKSALAVPRPARVPFDVDAQFAVFAASQRQARQAWSAGIRARSLLAPAASTATVAASSLSVSAATPALALAEARSKAQSRRLESVEGEGEAEGDGL